MESRPRVLALFGAGLLFGQERANIEALAALRDSGCEVLCLVRRDAWSKAVPAALAERGLAYKKISYIEQRLPGRLWVFLFLNPFTFVRANLEFAWIAAGFRPSVIYAFNQLFVLNFLPLLAITPAPMLYRAGDAPVRHNSAHRWVWARVVKRTQRFVANARFVQHMLVRNGVNENQIEIIYNKPPARRQGAAFAPSKRDVHDGPFRIAYVGQLTEAKGLGVLIEAFRTLRAQGANAALYVAGPISEWIGDAWTRTLVEAVGKDRALQECVHFAGYVDDVAGFLASADLHVCPSLYEEPAANVVMEAKQAGRASIVFPSGGLPELVENGVDGMVCADKSAETLAAALLSYVAAPEIATRQGLAAKASLERFGCARFGEHWRRVLDQTLLQDHRSRSVAV